MEDNEEIKDLIDDIKDENQDLGDSGTKTLADTIPDIDMSTLPSSLQFDGKTDIDDKEELPKEIQEALELRAIRNNVFRFFEDEKDSTKGAREVIKKYIKKVYDESGKKLVYHDFDSDGYFSYDDFKNSGVDVDNIVSKDTFLRTVKHFFYMGQFDSSFNDSVGMKSQKDRNKINKDLPPFDANKSTDTKELAIFSRLNSKKTDSLEVEKSVKLKYDTIEGIARDVASEFATRSFGMIAGAPGIGKTYCVEKAIEKGLEEWEPNERHKVRPTLVKVSGSIGKSYSDVVTFFYLNKNNKLILLDDADGFLTSPSQDIQNFLKAITNSTMKPVHVAPSIIARANNELKKEYEAQNEQLAENKNPNIKLDRFGNILSMREDINDSIYNAVENFKRNQDKRESYDDDGNAKELVQIKNDFIFDSSIIFISNLELSQLDDAVLSRMESCDIHLTPEEFVCRAEQILSTMSIGKYSSTSQDTINWAKKESFAYFKILLMNNNSYSDFHVDIKCRLTFRIIEKLTGTYIRHALDFCRTNHLKINDANNRLAIQNGVQESFIDDLIAILETNDTK